MHYCTFVLIGKTGDPDTLVAKAMTPFDEDLAVPAYRRYPDRHEITRMSKHYGVKTSDLHALAGKMPDWTGHDGGVDRRGLYCTTTCNPYGRWDWYEIGGRWDGYIKGAKRNVISTQALAKSPFLKGRLPCYVVTPGGTWLEHERYFPNGLAIGRVERKSDSQ